MEDTSAREINTFADGWQRVYVTFPFIYHRNRPFDILKKVDVHAFKEDYVGRQVSRYDVYNDTSTDLLWLGTKRADNWVETGLNLSDALKYYPKQGGIK